jgi:RNA ligase (TIGR02306 family)
VTDYIDSETDEVNLTACLGVEKWEPPCNSQDEEVPHTLFAKYTDIDNMRNYPNIIEDGEEVVITEKIHGCNSRYAHIDGEFMVGSHNIRIKENEHNKYWSVFSPELKKVVQQLGIDGAPVVAYGELYGSGIQDLTYGLKNNSKKVRLFDISVNCNYLDYDEFDSMCRAENIEVAPVLYRGPFSMEKVLSFSTSESALGGNMMEGVVVRPIKERRHPKIGRVILKYVFDQYLLRQDGTENH